MTIELKTDHEVFSAVWEHRKTHEIRLNDRNFEVGDMLRLRETRYTGEEMRAGKPLGYTGYVIDAEVTHILNGYGLMPGWVVLSIKVVGKSVV